MRKTLSLFIGIVLILVTLGIVMLASASSARDEKAAYFVIRQLEWLFIAAIAAMVTARLDYHLYPRFIAYAAVIVVGLLIAVRIPGIGHYVNGSWRWLRVGPFSLQPSELAKPTLILLLSWWLARNRRRIDEFRRGILVPFLLLGIFALPVVLEPDFGTTMLLAVVAVSLMFVGGVRIFPLVAMGMSGLLILAVLIFQNPERMRRIFAFLDPQKYEQGKAWQLVNSFRAFANGGLNGWWRGQGYGNSMQKYDYLPEAHTDFIFPIIGEELGLLASLIVMALYLLLFLLGVHIALRARDDFGRYTAFGITFALTFQALLNFAVVTGCVPTKGLALPFISYGGSSLLVSGIMVGILVNIARHAMAEPTAGEENLFKDRVRKV